MSFTTYSDEMFKIQEVVHDHLKTIFTKSEVDLLNIHDFLKVNVFTATNPLYLNDRSVTVYATTAIEKYKEREKDGFIDSFLDSIFDHLGAERPEDSKKDTLYEAFVLKDPYFDFVVLFRDILDDERRMSKVIEIFKCERENASKYKPTVEMLLSDLEKHSSRPTYKIFLSQFKESETEITNLSGSYDDIYFFEELRRFLLNIQDVSHELTGEHASKITHFPYFYKLFDIEELVKARFKEIFAEVESDVLKLRTVLIEKGFTTENPCQLDYGDISTYLTHGRYLLQESDKKANALIDKIVSSKGIATCPSIDEKQLEVIPIFDQSLDFAFVLRRLVLAESPFTSFIKVDVYHCSRDESQDKVPVLSTFLEDLSQSYRPLFTIDRYESKLASIEINNTEAIGAVYNFALIERLAGNLETTLLWMEENL